MKEIGTYSFTGYDWTGTGQGGCPLLGEIICRAATPPTLEASDGSGPFGGSYEIVAGSKAETRVIHLPESDDPSLSTGGGYVNSGWVQLTMAPYNFTFVYDVGTRPARGNRSGGSRLSAGETSEPEIGLRRSPVFQTHTI